MAMPPTRAMVAAVGPMVDVPRGAIEIDATGTETEYFTILLDLNLGKGSFEMLCSDLTEGYVNFNKSE